FIELNRFGSSGTYRPTNSRGSSWGIDGSRYLTDTDPFRYLLRGGDVTTSAWKTRPSAWSRLPGQGRRAIRGKKGNA
ncbi:hypothetical protein ACFXJJ_19065, partial [Streptomyces sp. NPDC059233]